MALNPPHLFGQVMGCTSGMRDSTEIECTVRLLAELHQQLVQLAQDEHRSFQSLLVTILRQAVDTQNNTTRQEVMDEWDERNRPLS